MEDIIYFGEGIILVMDKGSTSPSVGANKKRPKLRILGSKTEPRTINIDEALYDAQRRSLMMFSVWNQLPPANHMHISPGLFKSFENYYQQVFAYEWGTLLSKSNPAEIAKTIRDETELHDLFKAQFFRSRKTLE